MSSNDLAIVDCHTHVMRSEDQAKEFYDHLHWPLIVDGTVEDANRTMDETGVVHMNILMWHQAAYLWQGAQHLLSDDPSRRAKGEAQLKELLVQRMKDNNTWMLNVIKEHPRFSCQVAVEPVFMDEITMLEECQRGVSAGAVGTKWIPLDFGLEGDDPRMMPVYDFCAQTEVPITVQTSGRPGISGRPAKWASVLQEFPRLKINFAHMGYDSDWGGPADVEVAELCNKYDGAYADVSHRFDEIALGFVTREFAVQHLRTLGMDNVMFGTNWPLHENGHEPQTAPPGGPEETHNALDVVIEVLKTLPITDTEREKIASRNWWTFVGRE